MAANTPCNYILSEYACMAFILFLRLILCHVPKGCQGKHATYMLNQRCEHFRKGDVLPLLEDARQAHTSNKPEAYLAFERLKWPLNGLNGL